MNEHPIVRAVLVEWNDSRVMELYQVAEEDLPTPCTVHSVGWLVKTTDLFLIIARERIDGDWRGVLVIPRGCIVAETALDGRRGPV